MTNFARALATTSSRAAIGVALVTLGASPLFAQTDPTTPGPAPVADTAATATAAQPSTTIDDSKTIVVTGFRAALRSATARKKKTETVVESVTAEDIGKLPDNSIAESIARLPGLAAQRNNGRATIISIRGFGPDFSTTTLNGRQQTTTNDDRAVEFDQYPSEILAGVDIYKTSEADHTAGGLVGSIDLRTIRPLDYGRRVIAVGVRGAYVDQKLLPQSKDKGFRVFGTYVDQFADGNVGVALSAAYTDEPYQTRDYNAWGYADGGARGDATNPTAQGLYGIKTWFEADQLKRFGGTATVQGRLSDNLTMTLDGFYSHYIDNIDQKGFEMPLGYGQGHEAFLTSTATNGIITSATTVGTPLIENYATDRKADQYAFGWNALWDGHNGWKALVDLSMSRTNRTEHHIEETAGLGYGRDQVGPTATVSFVTTNHGPEFTSNYNGANPALVLTDVEGWSGGSFVQAGYDKVRTSKDDLKEARGEIERDFDSFIKGIKIGVDYTDRNKKLNQVDGFLAPPVGQTTAAIPTSLLGPTFTLDRGFGEILTWDPRAVENQNVLRYIPNIYPNGYDVTEKVFTPYVMAPLQAQLGGAALTGNIGLQGVHTDLVSKSASFPTAHDKYWMWLPSLNLNLRWNNGWVVRAAASKEYMRPRLNDLNNAINFHYDVTLNAYNGGGGNPFLRPYQAKALDFTVEKYFGSNGYIALQTFYKHIDTYVASGFVTNFDYSQFPPPPNEQVPPTSIGRFGGQVNTHSGYLYGAELAGTLPFDVFSSSLNGFGLTGGAGYTKTKIRDFNGNASVIPGYSKWVANLTAFYEKNGFNARASMRYRSGFQGDFVLFSGSLDRQQVLAETIYDAQIGYDFQPGSVLSGLSVFLQGQNLTDERQATIAIPTAPDSWLKYQTYGRRFLVGATYKFGGRAAPLPVAAPPPPPPPPPPVATQTCPDGSVILATDACPPPPPPPPPPPAPAATGERG